jgi:hypothetical protein
MLVHRLKLYSFRISQDKSGEDKYIIYDISKGITGQITLSAKGALSE